VARAQAVGEFEVLVQQVQKNAALVEHAVGAIAHARACAAPPAGPAADLQELQEHIEAHRVKACCLAEQPMLLVALAHGGCGVLSDIFGLLRTQ
jgi:hypothetical protein